MAVHFITCTIDRKYFVLKLFRVQKFNFRVWSQPQKLSMDRTLYVTLHTSIMGCDSYHRYIVS